jgi:hypothetical protein
MIRTAAFLAVACLALTGCFPRLPERVLVPFPVVCDQVKPAVPAWATDSLAPGADIWDKSKALLAERKQRISYEGQLETALDACTKPIETPAVK